MGVNDAVTLCLQHKKWMFVHPIFSRLSGHILHQYITISHTITFLLFCFCAHLEPIANRHSCLNWHFLCIAYSVFHVLLTVLGTPSTLLVHFNMAAPVAEAYLTLDTRADPVSCDRFEIGAVTVLHIWKTESQRLPKVC